MKNLYQHPTNWVWLCLLWAGLLSGQAALAQTIPDVQWSSSVSQGLAIKTDGTIVTTNSGSRQEAINGSFIPIRFPINYSLAGNRISSISLNGITILNSPSRPFGSFFTSVQLLAATANNETGYVGREYNTGSILITKLSASGENQLVTKGVGFSIFDDLTGTPDGGFVLLVTSTESTGKTVAVIRKYDSALNETWTKTVAFPTPNPATPDRSLTRGKTIINTPDGGYLVAGFYNTTGNLDAPQVGWVAKLNGQGDVAWQKLLDGLPNNADPGSLASMQSVNDAILATDGNGYALVGTGVAPAALGSGLSTAVLELNADGSFKRGRAVGPASTSQSYIARYNSSGQGYYAVGTSAGGQPLILLVNPANLSVVTQRTFTNSPDFGALTALAVAGDGSLVFAANNALVKLRAETPGGFTLLQPTYNCQTGAITFNTSGGDGSPITYSALGISRSSATSNSGTVEPGLRADPKTIPITGTQSGQSSTVIFDLAAFCSSNPQPPQPPQPPGFALLAPTYNCQTGAISFNISGGDGSPVTYSAPGIMRSSATSNSGTVEPGLRADPKTIPITGTQSGQTSTFVFDLPGLCGRQARLATPEDQAGLQIVVLGNPLINNQLVVEVSGANEKALDLALSEAGGRVMLNQRVVMSSARQRQTLMVGHLNGGIYLLRVSSDSETKVVKVVKQ